MAALALVWSFPLAAVAGTHLAGAGVSDNANFLWNFWWMREALGSGERFFSTPYLFAPFGTDLTLHTHTALNAFAGATLLERLPPLAAMNVTILASLFLNGFCAYVLAWRMTRDAGAAAIAGLIFGGSPYLAAHLNGHFNLTTAWTLPLFALAVGMAFGDRGDPKRVALQPSRSGRRAALLGPPLLPSIAAGVILGATAYIDYYYVVYEIAFAICACLLAARDWLVTARGATPASMRIARMAVALAIVDVIVILGILTTGGFDATIAGVRVLARDVFNPLQALWILLAIAAIARWRPALAVRPIEGWRDSHGITALATMALVGAVVALPILVNGAGVILRGEYVSQRYFWRNAPKGIDAATLVLGNPFHGLWGDVIRTSYQWLEIDPIESSAWLGIAPLILAAWTIRSHWHDSDRPLLDSDRHRLLRLGARSAPAGLRIHDRDDPAGNARPLHPDCRERPRPGARDRRGLARDRRPGRDRHLEVAGIVAAPLDRRRRHGAHHPPRLPAEPISDRGGRSAADL